MSTPITMAPVTGGVTAPRGFRAGAAHCGIAPSPSDLDLAVLATDTPVAAAGLFTTHPLPAAPVTVSQQHLAHTGGFVQAVVINSGSANASTGPEGLTHARLMAAETAAGFACAPEQVLVASTGVAGVRLPLTLLTGGIRAALGTMTRSGEGEASRVIVNTDGIPAAHAVTVHTARGSFVVGGMAKRSGTVGPGGAIALGFLTTDAWVAPTTLQHALELAARDTFAATVDGECSPNDSMLVLASGHSGVAVDDEDMYLALVEGLVAVLRQLVGDVGPIA